MNDPTTWLINQLTELKQDDQSFINKSLYQAAIELAKEQEKRAQQSQDELDGRIWSPDKWWLSAESRPSVGGAFLLQSVINYNRY